MKNTQTITGIRVVFAVIGAALVFAYGANSAYAQEGVGSSLSIAPTGQVIVKGATVTAISGSTITASTKWGSTVLTWTVHTTGSTRFVPVIPSKEAIQKIKVGHSISFSGALATSLSRPTVNAAVVQDEDLVQQSVSVVGTVESIDTQAGSFVLKTDNGTTSVRVGTGVLMSRDGNNAKIGSIAIGDSAKATGTLEVSTRTLAAERISIKSGNVASAVVSDGMFASFINWLKSSRGIMTAVRAR